MCITQIDIIKIGIIQIGIIQIDIIKIGTIQIGITKIVVSPFRSWKWQITIAITLRYLIGPYE